MERKSSFKDSQTWQCLVSCVFRTGHKLAELGWKAFPSSLWLAMALG